MAMYKNDASIVVRAGEGVAAVNFTTYILSSPVFESAMLFEFY